MLLRPRYSSKADAFALPRFPLGAIHVVGKVGGGKVALNRPVIQAIRRKLGDDCTGVLDTPLKPKWMRWATFERYAKRDAELSERDDGYLSPFLYRLLLKTGKLSN